MKQENYFGQNVDTVSKVLEQRGQMIDNPCQEGESLYRKFKETRQAPVKLAVALRGFFMETGTKSSQREEYGIYLRSRIRPTVEQLIAQEEVEKLECLYKLGWFETDKVDGFIAMAKKQQKVSALVWLLKLKAESVGFTDRDYKL